MTSPFGEFPSRPDRRQGQDDPESPPAEGARERLTEDDLWSDNSGVPSRPAGEAAPPDDTGAQNGDTSDGDAADGEAVDPAPRSSTDVWSRDYAEAHATRDGDTAAPLAQDDDPLAAATADDTSIAAAVATTDEGSTRAEAAPAGAAVATAELDAVDAVPETAEEAPAQSTGRKVRRVAWELTQTLVLAALIFMLVRGVAQNFRVEGPSMEPGLHNGQYLLVNKAVYFQIDLGTLSKYVPFIDAEEGETHYLFHGPERGDVVVFRYPRDPDRDFIKRVIGVPGDTVEISGGTVTVNGAALTEAYITPGSNSDMEPKVVPEESYFVMGDNRPNSSDSRTWGFVPEDNIIGKAMFSYWPLSDMGGIGNTSIDLGFVKIPLF